MGGDVNESACNTCTSTGSDSDPGVALCIPRAVTLERRDRTDSCHPLLCGKEGSEVCYLEAFAAVKGAQIPILRDQSTCTRGDTRKKPNTSSGIGDEDGEP